MCFGTNSSRLCCRFACCCCCCCWLALGPPLRSLRIAPAPWTATFLWFLLAKGSPDLRPINGGSSRFRPLGGLFSGPSLRARLSKDLLNEATEGLILPLSSWLARLSRDLGVLLVSLSLLIHGCPMDFQNKHLQCRQRSRQSAYSSLRSNCLYSNVVEKQKTIRLVFACYYLFHSPNELYFILS